MELLWNLSIADEIMFIILRKKCCSVKVYGELSIGKCADLGGSSQVRIQILLRGNIISMKVTIGGLVLFDCPRSRRVADISQTIKKISR